MFEIATYPGYSRRVNPSNVYQQAQNRRKPVLEGVEMAKTWSQEADRSKVCWLPAMRQCWPTSLAVSIR
ncbi:hypothetical protein Y032_0060g3098 [Ancylostoma ceylanicum]|uniref:Uncharacterized protein n=1 Tax=Ancylostoma ceylanicum TaxID=53326 RepID=A0A016U353_9BILA|nr:hypothetical protein Y032_0060g3098 [Ancylostoma ceylanicum]